VNTSAFVANLTRVGSFYCNFQAGGTTAGTIAPNGGGGVAFNTTSARALKNLYGARTAPHWRASACMTRS
jgi:hypothetical protein